MSTHRTAAAGTPLAVLASVILASVTVAGCAHPATNTPGATTMPSASVNPSASQSAGPSTPASVSPSGSLHPSSPAAGELTLTGQVLAGVESGCLLLRSGATAYQLVGGDRTVLAEGAQVQVTGQPAPGLMTTCQQGTPFRVSTARRL